MPDTYASRLALSKLLLRSVGGNSASRAAAASTVREYERSVFMAASIAATTTMAVTVDDSTSQPIRLSQVTFVPNSALTANATNYKILSVVWNNGNGGSDTVLMRINTTPTANGGTGNMTAQRRYTLNTVSATDIPSGSMVQFKVSHAGTGVALPIGSVIIKADFKE